MGLLGVGKKPLGAEFMHMNLVSRMLVFPLTPGSYSVPPAGTHHQPGHGDEG